MCLYVVIIYKMNYLTDGVLRGGQLQPIGGPHYLFRNSLWPHLFIHVLKDGELY